MAVTFVGLPVDLHLIFITYLTTEDLVALWLTCRHFYTLVETHGWSLYRRHNLHDVSSSSMLTHFTRWPDKQRVAHALVSHRNFRARRFGAQALCAPWPGIFHPVMAMGPSGERMAVVAGNALITFSFSNERIRLETRVGLPYATSRDGKKDLVGLAFVPDRFTSTSSADRTLVVVQTDGTVERLSLPHFSDDGSVSVSVHDPQRVVKTATYPRVPNMKDVTCLTARGQTVLILSRTGQTALYTANAPWEAPAQITLPSPSAGRRGRSWTALLAPDNTSTVTWAAFGRSHVDAPLSIHAIRPESGLDAVPLSVLHGASSARGAAVYALAHVPTQPHLLLSGWYDGAARLYDLRAHNGKPTMELRDPWTHDALFSVSASSSSSYLVGAGTARHGLVALFDLRSPTVTHDGWSVYAPGRAESSPVYGLQLEESRMFGLTRTRAFALDFSGVGGDVFPELRGETGVGARQNVMRYEHSKGR